MQWAGRTNDINEAQRLRNEGQLTDVYTGGRQDNFHAAAIERALTQRDEFGNIMTPKERFRNLCYRCEASQWCPDSLLKYPSEYKCAARCSRVIIFADSWMP